MSCNDAVQTGSGAFVSIGTFPATFTETACEAAVVEKIGEITNIGGIGSKTFNTETREPLDSRAVIEKKTNYTRPSVSLALGINDADLGQIDAKAALELDDCYLIKLTRQDGSARYIGVQVSGFEYDDTTNAFENCTITLLPQTDAIDVEA